MSKPYSTRSDIEKLKSNWKKTLGLFARREYSLSILRAAVTAELALNHAIRHELGVKHGLPSDFIDKQLLWANGIKGKLDRLYVPILAGTRLENKTKEIAKELKRLNTERNNIAHRGEFRKKETAQQYLELAEKEVNTLVKRYDKSFKLNKFNPSRSYERTVIDPIGGGSITMPMHPGDDEK